MNYKIYHQFCILNFCLSMPNSANKHFFMHEKLTLYQHDTCKLDLGAQNYCTLYMLSKPWWHLASLCKWIPPYYQPI